MFNFFNKKNKRFMDMVSSNFIKPTSKMALKQQCIILAKGDLEESKKLYDFLIQDLQDIPDIDPIPMTWMDNFGNNISKIFEWGRQNQDVLSQAYEFIQGITKGRNPQVPIDSNTQQSTDLPPIN